MSMPFYVAPEQMMKDRADFARKGISRGRALAALSIQDGVLLCAENHSRTLRKISEIYDRVAFAGVGRYNEFDQLRIAGVRHADLKGYTYSREDVDARSLANQYAQLLGQTFTHELKPMEVEILIAEVATNSAEDQMFHVLYDGTINDESGFTVLGGAANSVAEKLDQTYEQDWQLSDALKAAAEALSHHEKDAHENSMAVSGVADLEVALLARNHTGRAFQRIEGDELATYLRG
ncbi:MAG: proteasome subunit alpha [Acidimicrobiia bacterium]|nr:proteasome subunit alpha [Acidimicrobiia bacterium]MYC58484.1 proteasome subunit alpha [Acidimicrobiia bacterium]MYG94242.1 proteasome subunit alpha [Acidimicrobiia bacterium]MYI30410.1 proteasome subunit alpha [Acidimicrobiia bacterium]